MTSWKNRLQELYQPFGYTLPDYDTSVSTNSDGLPMFTCTVTIHTGKAYTGDPCTNKKAAEQSAAEVAYKAIHKVKPSKGSTNVAGRVTKTVPTKRTENTTPTVSTTFKLMTKTDVSRPVGKSPVRRDKKTIYVPADTHILVDADHIDVMGFDREYEVSGLGTITAYCGKGSPVAQYIEMCTIPLISVESGCKDAADTAMIVHAGYLLRNPLVTIIVVSRDHFVMALKDVLAVPTLGLRGKVIRCVSMAEVVKMLS